MNDDTVSCQHGTVLAKTASPECPNIKPTRKCTGHTSQNFRFFLCETWSRDLKGL